MRINRLHQIFHELADEKLIHRTYYTNDSEKKNNEAYNKKIEIKTNSLIEEGIEIIKELHVHELKNLLVEQDVKGTVFGFKFQTSRLIGWRKVLFEEIKFQYGINESDKSSTQIYKQESHTNTSRKIWLAYKLGLIESIRTKLKDEYTSQEQVLNVLFDLGVLNETDNRRSALTRLKETSEFKGELPERELNLITKEYPKFNF